MAVALFYFKGDNTIFDVVDNVVSLKGSELRVIGGSISGWNEDELGVIISNDITITEHTVLEEEPDTKAEKQAELEERLFGPNEDEPSEDEVAVPRDIVNGYRLVKQVVHDGVVIDIGDPVPNITDITSEFVIVDDDTDNRIADLELMLAELLMGGM